MAYTTESLTRALQFAGDAIVDYRNSTGANRYTVVTADFDNKYIQKKLSQRRRPFEETGIVVFSWDMDKFRVIDPATVTNVTPLSSVLKNG